MTDMVPDYRNYVPEIDSKLQDINQTYQLGDNTTTDKSFCYLVGEAIGTIDIDGNAFCYSDGCNDHSIDFYFKNDDDYVIGQCKAAQIETLDNTKPPLFDNDAINQVRESVEYLFDMEQTAKGNKEVERLRSDFQSSFSEGAYSLKVVLAVIGDLSEAASNEIELLKQELEQRNARFQLITWKTIYESWHEIENTVPPKDIVVKLAVDSEKDILQQKNWVTAVAYASDLVEAYKKYGIGLFDLNVRSKLAKSPINGKISASAADRKLQKMFVHMNNGLLIVCNNYSLSQDKTHITVKGAQIVNGCQTVNALYDSYKEMTNIDKDYFEKNVRVIVKVIQNLEESTLNKIVIATNNQNKMNPRNLKSNTSEQSKLQKDFAADGLTQSFRYFYIRKDGELDAALESPHAPANFRRSNFKIEGGAARRKSNRYRSIDNEELAKVWLSWLGDAPAVNPGGLNYFDGDEYGIVFRDHPTETFWKELAKTDFTFQKEKNLREDGLIEEGQASPYQFLLAYAVYKYCDYKIREEYESKPHATARLKDTGAVRQGASQEEIDHVLLQDTIFQNARFRKNMTFAFCELASFALVNKYGPLTPMTCNKLLSQDGLCLWTERGMDEKSIAAEDLPAQDSLLGIIWGYLKLTTDSYFKMYRDTIINAPRFKMYLSSQNVISEIKEMMLKKNDDWVGEKEPWKTDIKKTILESFPSL